MEDSKKPVSGVALCSGVWEQLWLGRKSWEVLQHPEMSLGETRVPRVVAAFTIRAAGCRPGLVTTGAHAGPRGDNRDVSVPLCHAEVAVPGVCGSSFSLPVWGPLWE